MTSLADALLALPQVQDAIDYVLRRAADWQRVPARISIAQREVLSIGAQARTRSDAGTLAQLTILRQSLDGLQQEYQESAGLMASVLEAARAANAGRPPNAGPVADAGRLAAVVAAGLSALQRVERQLQSFGANLTAGPGGGLGVPRWISWGAVGLGVWWFYRRVFRRRT